MTIVPTMHRVPYSWLALSIFLVEFVIIIPSATVCTSLYD